MLMKHITKIIMLNILLMTTTILFSAPNGDEFINHKPDFVITVPTGWHGGAEDADRSKGEFMIKYTGEWRMPSLSVIEAHYFTEATELKTLTEGAILSLKKNYKGKNFEVIYSKEIKMSDGSQGFEAEIKWQHPMKITLYSTHVWVRKNSVSLAAVLTNMKMNEESLKAYLYTLTIKP